MNKNNKMKTLNTKNTYNKKKMILINGLKKYKTNKIITTTITINLIYKINFLTMIKIKL